MASNWRAFYAAASNDNGGDYGSDGEMTVFQECQAIVNEYFEGDAKKITAWWNTPNPGLGDAKPSDLIEIGKAEKLLRIIKGWREGDFA